MSCVSTNNENLLFHELYILTQISYYSSCVIHGCNVCSQLLMSRVSTNNENLLFHELYILTHISYYSSCIIHGWPNQCVHWYEWAAIFRQGLQNHSTVPGRVRHQLGIDRILHIRKLWVWRDWIDISIILSVSPSLHISLHLSTSLSLWQKN